MPSCAVTGCKTGYGKQYPSYTCFQFPLKNPGRFLKWKKALNRKNFEPNESTRICERHFDESHIRRIDCRGKPTKRPHLHEWAYPTLNMRIKVLSTKNKAGTTEYAKDETADDNKVEHNYSTIHADSSMSELDDITDSEEEYKDLLKIENKVPEVRNEVIDMLQHEVGQLKEDKVFLTQKYVNDTEKFHVELAKLRKENATMKTELAKATSALRGVERVFNPDQIRRLERLQEKTSFSDKTMIESAQFHRLCGHKPYNYLIDKGYPFPSERAMQRFKNHIKEKEPEKYEEFLKANSAVVEEAKEKLALINAKRRVKMNEVRASRTQEERDRIKAKRHAKRLEIREKMIQNGTYVPPKKKVKKVKPPKKKTSRKKKENSAGSKKKAKKKENPAGSKKKAKKKENPAGSKKKAKKKIPDKNDHDDENDFGAAQHSEAMIEPEKNVDPNAPVDDAELQASVDFLMDLENEASSDSIIEVDSFVKPPPQPTHVLLAVPRFPDDPVPKERLDKNDYFI